MFAATFRVLLVSNRQVGYYLMKSRFSSLVLAFAFALIAGAPLANRSLAGPAPAAAKEVAPIAAPGCDWSGFYVGVYAGGEFGHSEDKDLDNYNFPDKPWGYSEDSFTGGEEAGYNFQFGWFVTGPEFDLGYINVDGHGIEPGFPQDTFGRSSSDFYGTFRGRVGVALGCWLVYGTGGGIMLNYDTEVVDTSLTVAGPDSINARKEELDWGYTVGGGVERMFEMCGHRWSLKAEYLYFSVSDRTFSATSGNGFGPFGWRAETEGHIVRAGLNFHF